MLKKEKKETKKKTKGGDQTAAHYKNEKIKNINLNAEHINPHTKYNYGVYVYDIIANNFLKLFV